MDHQVKLRGFRIELGEIEAILRQHPDVAQAVAIIREDQPGDKRIVSYVVPTDSLEVKGIELRTYLTEKLPEYMVPSAIVEMTELPLTPNGKLDRKALPAPDYTAQPEQVYVAPRTPLEESLVEMWAEVLKVPRVGINDNFFKLGGHSLLATQLISRVRNTFKVELPLRNLFETPTVAGLATAIIESQQEGPDNRPAVITRNRGYEAKGLLSRIDQLSDEEVDSLLNDALVKAETE